ncbi:Protein of unknown function [Gryllus bimaculatus]|nr:Protein of unknown function [Gryllus bimaculatus]
MRRLILERPSPAARASRRRRERGAGRRGAAPPPLPPPVQCGARVSRRVVVLRERQRRAGARAAAAGVRAPCARRSGASGGRVARMLLLARAALACSAGGRRARPQRAREKRSMNFTPIQPTGRTSRKNGAIAYRRRQSCKNEQTRCGILGAGRPSRGRKEWDRLSRAKSDGRFSGQGFPEDCAFGTGARREQQKKMLMEGCLGSKTRGFESCHGHGCVCVCVCVPPGDTVMLTQHVPTQRFAPVESRVPAPIRPRPAHYGLFGGRHSRLRAAFGRAEARRPAGGGQAVCRAPSRCPPAHPRPAAVFYGLRRTCSRAALPPSHAAPHTGPKGRQQARTRGRLCDKGIPKPNVASRERNTATFGIKDRRRWNLIWHLASVTIRSSCCGLLLSSAAEQLKRLIACPPPPDGNN